MFCHFHCVHFIWFESWDTQLLVLQPAQFQLVIKHPVPSVWGDGVAPSLLYSEVTNPYSTRHWSLKVKCCLAKSLNGRLHAKERFWQGLQFCVCGDNICWRTHQLNKLYFLQLEWSKIFVSLAILYFFLAYLWP